MSQSRLEFKVGIFVFICLALLALLLLQFSKGTNLFRPTYTIYLTTKNVGGLRVRSQVLMSGVEVGKVAKAQLSPEGTIVTVALNIYKPYIIHRSARFSIEQFGFLGDQYVAIYPEGNQGPVLEQGAQAEAQEPFNLQDVARGAAGFITRIDETAKKLNDAINDVRRLVLNEQTLTNLSVTVGTFRQVAEDAVLTVKDVDELVISNKIPAGLAVSNLMAFSEELKSVGLSAQDVVNTNAPQIGIAVSNVVTSTAMLTNLLAQVQEGHGLAGTVLRNDQLANDFSALASNLALTSRNLNEHGLWRVLWGPKHHEPESEPKPAPPPTTQGRGTFQQ
jgi:phospholipid/cholesterol/gamma-HCH transport system substrate-binding protein